MKTLLAIIALGMCAPALSGQVDIPYQELNYNVKYRLGPVDIDLAHGVVTMQTAGNSYYATLDGHSIPWEGRVFCISDTLNTVMTPSSPASAETITYQNGWYMKPPTEVYESGQFEPTDPANYRNTQGQGTLNASPVTMELISVTTNMLSMFYYAREIDFDAMQPGQSICLPITVEGGVPERVEVTYNGRSTYEINGCSYPTYDITFEYSYNGAMCGYPVKGAIGISSRLILNLTASLPFGHVEMIYNGE